ncbi:hypothetical protein HZS_1108 [Henneguya salminicola]|nr:hypothetical protein HZS_1108 [Henneguya salminicola]
MKSCKVSENMLMIICESDVSWNVNLKEYLYAFLDCKTYTIRLGHSFGKLSYSQSIEINANKFNSFNFSHFQLIFYYENLPEGLTYIHISLNTLIKSNNQASLLWFDDLIPTNIYAICKRNYQIIQEDNISKKSFIPITHKALIGLIFCVLLGFGLGVIVFMMFRSKNAKNKIYKNIYWSSEETSSLIEDTIYDY